jgi:hypothetical protein
MALGSWPQMPGIRDPCNAGFPNSRRKRNAQPAILGTPRIDHLPFDPGIYGISGDTQFGGHLRNGPFIWPKLHAGRRDAQGIPKPTDRPRGELPASVGFQSLGCQYLGDFAGWTIHQFPEGFANFHASSTMFGWPVHEYLLCGAGLPVDPDSDVVVWSGLGDERDIGHQGSKDPFAVFAGGRGCRP